MPGKPWYHLLAKNAELFDNLSTRAATAVSVYPHQPFFRWALVLPAIILISKRHQNQFQGNDPSEQAI